MSFIKEIKAVFTGAFRSEPPPTVGEKQPPDGSATPNEQQGEEMGADAAGPAPSDEGASEAPTSYNFKTIAVVFGLVLIGLLAVTKVFEVATRSDDGAQANQPVTTDNRQEPIQKSTPGVDGNRRNEFQDPPNAQAREEALRQENPSPRRANPQRNPDRLGDRQADARRQNPYAQNQQQMTAAQQQEMQRRRQMQQQMRQSLSNVRQDVSPSMNPAAMGPPRNPQSGRPYGQPQTVADFQQEQGVGPNAMREQLAQRYPFREELSDSEKFLEQVRSRGGGSSSPNSVQGPLGTFVIPRGTVIPIALESEVNSDLPGTVIARVTSDVYDRSLQHVLIPKGSEIVNDYGQATQVGQSRLLVSATRLNLPDGRYVNFTDARATGPTGAAGLEDIKDRHLFGRFAGVGALAIFGALVNSTDLLGGVGLSQQDTLASGEVVIAAGGGVSARSGFAGSFVGQVNRIIGELLQRQINRQPTIKLRPGLRGQLVLNEDIDLQRPYYEGGDDWNRIDREMSRYRQDRDLRRAAREVEQLQRRSRGRSTMNELRQSYYNGGYRPGSQPRGAAGPGADSQEGGFQAGPYQGQAGPYQGASGYDRSLPPQQPFMTPPNAMTPRERQVMQSAPQQPPARPSVARPYDPRAQQGGQQ